MLAVLYRPHWIYKIRGSKIVPRLKADGRISLKERGRKTVRIELVRQLGGRKFWVRRDGKDSVKVPEATATEIARRIRQWLVQTR